MKRAAIVCLGLVVLIPVLFIGAAAGVLSAGAGAVLGQPLAFTETLAGVPGEYLRLFQAAGVAYDVPWPVLAGIAKVECDDGQDPDPACTQPGAVNSAGAGGPMQFLASTWEQYGVSVDGRPPDRWDAADAIYAAAKYLKANGAPAEVSRAIFAYNHSSSYVQEVLRWAAIYEREAQSVASASGGVAQRALAFALSQQGVPYVWGGESPAGYDCSGLVQAAYRAAGIALPRTAQEQYDAGPHVPADARLEPGDLVFFGQSASDVEHVGICGSSCRVEHVGIVVNAAQGLMVDAPHPGVVVRVEAFPTTVGAAYGEEVYLGATRPTGQGASL